MKPYYQRAGATLYLGDCLEVLPALGRRFDLAVTSPPYNRGSRIDGAWQGVTTASCKAKRFRGGYGRCTDDLPWDEYRSWLRRAVGAVWGVLDGALWLNHKPRIVNGLLWTPLEAVEGLPLRQVVIWDTGPGVNFHPGAFVPAHEWVLLVAPADWRLVSRKAGVAGDVWRFPRVKKKAGHPAPFPVGLPLRCIEASPCSVVLDPFAGLGTTLSAAVAAGVEGVGVEIDERWCEKAARRLEREADLFSTVEA